VEWAKLLCALLRVARANWNFSNLFSICVSSASVNTYYIILDIFLWACPGLRFPCRTSVISAPFVLRPAQDVAANVSKTLGENSRKSFPAVSRREWVVKSGRHRLPRWLGSSWVSTPLVLTVVAKIKLFSRDMLSALGS